jgi:hypothetical protein
MLGFVLPGASAWEEATEFAERSGLLAIPWFPCLRSSKPSPSWRTFAIGSSANASPSPVDRRYFFLSLPHQASSTNWFFDMPEEVAGVLSAHRKLSENPSALHPRGSETRFDEVGRRSP